MGSRAPDLEEWDVFLLLLLSVACHATDDGWISEEQLGDVCEGIGAHARRAIGDGWANDAARRGLVRTRGVGRDGRLRPERDDLVALLDRLR